MNAIGLLEDVWLEGLVGIVAFSALIYYLWTANYNYWKRRNVPYLQPTFPFGNTKELLSPISYQFIGHVYGNFYLQLQGHKYGGIISVRKPILILRDPNIIKQIITKDFNYFTDRGITYDEKTDPLSAHLFNLKEEKWRKLRTQLTPAFTSGKMKAMFQVMEACGKELEKSLKEHAEKEETIDIKDFMDRFGTDVVGSCSFGLNIDSLNNPNNEFRRISSSIFEQNRKSIIRTILNLLIPGLSYALKMKSHPKEREEFFFKIVRETVEYREKNNIKMNDFLALLIQMKNKDYESNDTKKSYSEKKSIFPSSNDTHLTNELMTAQCFVFFIAGFDTSSSALSFCFYELALNKSLQKKLQDEIDKILVKHNGEISYECLKEMTYMDQVIQETLRKYPPIVNILRECKADYRLEESNIVIEKGVQIAVPLYGLHHDPEYYPEPERFDPERFSDEAKNSRHPYTYLPFGDGPRNCIGIRFAIMQIKTALVKVLSNFDLHRTPETKKPEISNQSIIAKPKYGIKIKITKRVNNFETKIFSS